MITTQLLNLVNTLIGWFLSLRPVWLPTVPSGVTDVISFYRAYDTLLPVGEALTAVGVTCAGVLAFVALKWTVKLVDWVADVIP